MANYTTTGMVTDLWAKKLREQIDREFEMSLKTMIPTKTLRQDYCSGLRVILQQLEHRIDALPTKPHVLQPLYQVTIWDEWQVMFIDTNLPLEKAEALYAEKRAELPIIIAKQALGLIERPDGDTIKIVNAPRLTIPKS